MTKTAPKIAKIELLKGPRRNGWPTVKVREITPGGRVLNAYEFNDYHRALRCAQHSAREHGAEFVNLIAA